MKYRLALILVILAVSGMVVALVGAQSTPDATLTPNPGISSVIREDIFVRAGPGQEYLPVGRLVAGDTVVPVSRNANADWVMIRYHRFFGWIRRDLASWVENIDALPVISDLNLTPSPVGSLTQQPTATILFFPTDTPTGNWVTLQDDIESAYVRAGPGRIYALLGQLFPGNLVEPVGRNADTSWVMIRFGAGFGWIGFDLVRWADDLENLPILSPDNLTPSATFTPSDTPTVTLTPTNTFTPTVTASDTATPTATSTTTPSYTPTATDTPSATPSDTPTATWTLTETLTATITPTATAIATEQPSATTTEIPSATSTSTFTETVTSTETPTAAPSATPVPSNTPTEIESAESPTPAELAVVASDTPSPTATITPSVTPTLTASPTVTETATVSASATSIPTNTALPTETASSTSAPASQVPVIVPPSDTPILATATPSATNTPVLPSATAPKITATASKSAGLTGNGLTITPTLQSESVASSGGGGIPSEAILGGIIVVLVLVYVGLYWRGLVGMERYSGGFVVERCPVCQRGHLIVETRQERLFGIPRPRRTVRCDECRSVLRETSPRRWRYAVDPIENPDLYRRYNGQELDEQALVELANQSITQHGNRPVPRPPGTPPDFVDDDQ